MNTLSRNLGTIFQNVGKRQDKMFHLKKETLSEFTLNLNLKFDLKGLGDFSNLEINSYIFYEH